MSKIKRLVEELKNEVKKETGFEPTQIRIAIHSKRDLSHYHKDLNFHEANEAFNRLNQYLGMDKKISSSDGAYWITGENEILDYTVFFEPEKAEVL